MIFKSACSDIWEPSNVSVILSAKCVILCSIFAMWMSFIYLLLYCILLSYICCLFMRRIYFLKSKKYNLVLNILWKLKARSGHIDIIDIYQ